MVNVVLIKMPLKTKATHTANADGSYTIFINDRLCYFEQKEAYRHEIAHILNNDLYSEDYADAKEWRLKYEKAD